MQKRQPKHEALKCTHKDCQRLQDEDGEFCKRHLAFNPLPQELKQEKLIARLLLTTPQLRTLHKILELEREMTLLEEDPT